MLVIKENELLDFSGNIWERDMDAVAAEIRRLGIKEFTVSASGTRLLEMLADFEKRGFWGIRTGSDEEKTKPAILMKVE